MKRKILYSATAMLCVCATLFASCGGGNNPSDVTTAAPEEPTAVVIHSIGELNTDEGALDSHAGRESASRLELNERESTTISQIRLGIENAYYPRVKLLSDGSYIMFYQTAQLGGSVYYVTSKNLVKWDTSRILFQKEPVTVDGANDTRLFTTCDAILLANGELLAVASYRASSAYSKNPAANGIVMKKSTDNGATWSAYSTIYVGTNWEPSLLQTASGEVHCYFTNTTVYAEDNSTGTAMIRSTDNGATWSGSLSEPYSGQIIVQQKTNTLSDGTLIFSDQMPSGTVLHDGSIALATEARQSGGKYNISVSYSTDNWATALEKDKSGPSVKLINTFSGAAPYLRQFVSGETALSYNVSNTFRVKLGNTTAKRFYGDNIPFDGNHMWGTIEIDGSHSLVAAIPDISTGDASKKTSDMQIGRMYLNHDISAANNTVTIDGNNSEWSVCTDALFVGSASQAQVAVRAAYDDNNIYLLEERLDEYLTSADTVTVCICTDEAKGEFYRIIADNNGVASFSLVTKDKTETLDATALSSKVYIDGSVDSKEGGKDVGSITEIAIPKSILGNIGEYLSTAVILANSDEGEKAVSDTMDNVSLEKPAEWIRINLKYDKPAS